MNLQLAISIRIITFNDFGSSLVHKINNNSYCMLSFLILQKHIEVTSRQVDAAIHGVPIKVNTSVLFYCWFKVIRKFFSNYNKSFRWHLGDYERHNFFHLKPCERRNFGFCVFLRMCSGSAKNRFI